MPITLQQVDRSNWEEAIAIQTTDEQVRFAPAVAVSLSKISIKPDGDKITYVPFAIYNEDVMVGFIMHAFDDRTDYQYWINGFIIDKKYQGQGYGRAAMIEMIRHIKDRNAHCKEIKLTVHKDNPKAKQLYEQLGFEVNGSIFGDEIGMCKKLLDSDRTEYELEAEQLKQILLHIEANGHQVPSDHNPWELAQLMMKHIGSQDATLRDKLIYSTMCRWLSPNVFTTDQMRELLHQSLDKDHLFYKLGENGTNSVFTRTFSVLIIPLVIGEHCKSPFLEKEDLALTLNCVLHYIEHERDIRGYVRGKGWAHAIAHAADAIDELAQVATITKDELSRMLVTIQNKLLNIQEVLLYQEDERLVTAIISILNQLKWSEDEINEWLKGFSEHTTRGTIEKSPEYLLNIKNVLLDLNKRIASQRAFQNVTPVIQMTIKQIYL